MFLDETIKLFQNFFNMSKKYKKKDNQLLRLLRLRSKAFKYQFNTIAAMDRKNKTASSKKETL